MNGHKDDSSAISTNVSHNTLSGFEAADTRNNWENFKHLLSYETNEMPYESDSDKVTLVVSVEDTGIGIPLDAQGRVFTPFMQADSSTSRNYGGTGIGLSISKCLVEIMGGQINFVSRPHVGSTFTFTALLQRCDRSAIIDSKPVTFHPLPSSFKGLSALLVDKRPVRATVTKYHLQRLGMASEVVSTIELALGVLSGRNGCSLTSMKQPSMLLIESDSWGSKIDVSLRTRLLEMKQNDCIPVSPKVILLAAAESDNLEAKYSVDSVITKPLKASTLATCLFQALGITQLSNEKRESSGSLRGLLLGKNILVVDDNKVNLRVAAGTLKKYGAKVDCVESGKDALALLQVPHKFDLCLMDIQMPEMDGFEATRQIRAMEAKANELAEAGNDSETDSTAKTAKWHLPILAMTADVIQATFEECTKCGMDGYVSKPFEEKQLFQAVQKFSDSGMSS